MKIEHVRMRLAHEGLSQDLVDMELIELKFIFDRSQFLFFFSFLSSRHRKVLLSNVLFAAHHDNRDFDVLPNYQPRGQPTFNDQTLLINSPGVRIDSFACP